MKDFWSKIKSFFLNPATRYKAILGVVGAIVLVIAVFFSGDIINLFKIFGPRAGEMNWSTAPYLTATRSDAATVQVDLPNGTHYLYTLGGFVKTSTSGEANFLNTVERLKINDQGMPVGEWSPVPEMLSARAGLRAIAYDDDDVDDYHDYIYAVAGDFHIPPSGEFGPYSLSINRSVMNYTVPPPLPEFLAQKDNRYTASQWQRMINAGIVWAWHGKGGIQLTVGGSEYISGGAGSPWINAKDITDNWSYQKDGINVLFNNGDTLLVKIGNTDGPGEPLPYSTVERLNLQTNQWEPVSRLLDVNFYPEVAISNGKLHITGGVYGHIYKASSSAIGDYTFNWGSFSGTTPEPNTGGTEGGTGDIESGLTPTSLAPSGGLLAFLGNLFRPETAQAANEQSEFDFWFNKFVIEGDFTKVPTVGKLGTPYLIHFEDDPTWDGTRWTTVVSPGTTEYRIGTLAVTKWEWRGQSTPGDPFGGTWVPYEDTITFFYKVVNPDVVTNIPRYPPPNPNYAYSNSLISGSFATTMSIYYACDLSQRAWSNGEMYDRNGNYSFADGFFNSSGALVTDKVVKIGVIRLAVRQTASLITGAPTVSVSPVAQGRYGHQLIPFSQYSASQQALRIFGGASFGSPYYLASSTTPVSDSPFWVIKDSHPKTVLNYTYKAPVSLVLSNIDGRWYEEPNSLFKDDYGYGQGRAFHKVVKLNSSTDSNYLLSAGGVFSINSLNPNGVPVTIISDHLERLDAPAVSWSIVGRLDPNSPAYLMSAVSTGSKAVFAGGVQTFPVASGVLSMWPNLTATAANKTYLWQDSSFSILSSAPLVNHGSSLLYAGAPVATQTETDKHFSLYLTGGYNTTSTTSVAAVEVFSLTESIPAELSLENSYTESSPPAVLADGTQVVTITVFLRDTRDNPVEDGRYQVGLWVSLPEGEIEGTGAPSPYKRLYDSFVGPSTGVAVIGGKAGFKVNSTEATLLGARKAWFKAMISDKSSGASYATGLYATADFSPAVKSVGPNFLQLGRNYTEQPLDVSVKGIGTHFNDTYNPNVVWLSSFARKTQVALVKASGGISLTAKSYELPANENQTTTVSTSLRDATGNPLVGKEITFSIARVSGDWGGSSGTFSNGGANITVKTDNFGVASATYKASNSPGIDRITAIYGTQMTTLGILNTDPYPLNKNLQVRINREDQKTLSEGVSTDIVANFMYIERTENNEEIMVPLQTNKAGFFMYNGDSKSVLNSNNNGTNASGKMTATFTAGELAPRPIEIVAWAYWADQLVLSHLIIYQEAPSTSIQISGLTTPLDDSAALRKEEDLSFRITGVGLDVVPGSYYLQVTTTGAVVQYYSWAIDPLGNRIAVNQVYRSWAETVLYPFTIYGENEERLLAINPDRGNRGSTVLVTVTGSANLVVSRQITTIELVPQNPGFSGPAGIKTEVTFAGGRDGLIAVDAKFNIAANATPGWWDVYVVTDLGSEVKRYGPLHFLVIPHKIYLIDLQAASEVQLSKSTPVDIWFVKYLEEGQLESLGGRSIQLTWSGGGKVEPITVVTDRGILNPSNLGHAQVIYTANTVPGGAVITATSLLPSEPATASITITKVGTLTVSRLVVQATQHIPADGVSKSTVLVTVLDKDNIPLEGRSVTLTSDRGQYDKITFPTPNNTNSAGQAFFYVSSTQAGTSTVIAVSGGISGSTQIIFDTPGTSDEYDLLATVTLEAKTYDGSVWVIVKDNTAGTQSINNVYAVGTDKLIRDSEGKLLKVYLIADHKYVLWVKGKYHKARKTVEFNTSQATLKQITLQVPILSVGDFAGASPLGFRSGFNDNNINTIDAQVFFKDWFKDSYLADIVIDQQVNTADFFYWLTNYGSGTPIP